MDDSLDWRLQYAIDYFNKQQEDMHRLKERINYTVALLLTPIASALYFIYTNSNFTDLSLVQQLPLGLLLFVASVLFSVSATYIFISLIKAHEYPYPQLPSKLSTFYNALPTNGEPLSKLRVEMLGAYEGIIDDTKKLNDIRNKAIITSQRIAAYSLPLLLVSAILAFSYSFTVSEKPKKFEIVNSVKFIKELPDDKQQQKPTSATEQPLATATCTINTLPAAKIPCPRDGAGSRRTCK